VSPAERIYRLLLRVYPTAFRQRYQDELIELFRDRRDRHREAEGEPGIRFWIWVLRDLATSAWREWFHPTDSRDRDGRATRGGDGMATWVDDLGYAIRRLSKSPGFGTTATLILALGIGVSTTAFSFVNSLLFQPPPFDDPARVVLILEESEDGVPNSTSYPAYRDIQRMDEVFEAVAAHSTGQVFVEQEGAPVPLLAEYATASYLRVIGLAPSRGNWFDEVADEPTGPPLAVLTHKLWAVRLGGDPDVIGRTLRIGGRAVTVVGVGPEAFNGGTGPAAIDLWLSISAMGPTGGPARSLTRRQDHPFQVRARLAPAVTIARAADEIDRLAGELAATYPESNAGQGISVISLATNLATPDERAAVVPAATFVMAVVGLVLLIGTLNLANLLLVRSTARARELSVRLALGATRGRLVRLVLSEALVLAALGGLAGSLLAVGTLWGLGRLRVDVGLPASLDVTLDGRVVIFATVVTVAAGMLFGLIPAVRATSRGVAGPLSDEAGAMIGARRRFGLAGTLVAAQVTVSLLLLAVAAVFLESLARAHGSEPGFAWESTGYVTLGTRALDLDPDAAALLHERLRERLLALPEVSGVTVAATLPGRMFGSTTLMLGAALRGVDSPTEVPWNYVTPDFFGVMRIPVLFGRSFRLDDVGADPVAIASEMMALTYWGRTDIVGETYRAESAPDVAVEIVGVVGDVPIRALGEAPRPAIYFPTRGALATPHYLFSAAGRPDAALAPIRAAVAEVDSRILVLAAAPMRRHLGDTLERQRLAGLVLAGLGALALVLAVLGVYGVVSFAVSRRRHEVGIRVALGAGRDSVVRLFVRDVAAIVGVGALVGVGLSVPLSRMVGQLFAGGPGTPLAVAAPAALLLVTALVATVIPAARAARGDPTLALRRE
jgi:predicted permease